MYSIYILYTCISLWYNYDPKMKERMNKQGLGHRSVAVVFVDGRSEVGVHATHQPSHRKSTSYIILMVLYKMPSKCICIYIWYIQYIRGISLSFFQKSLHVTYWHTYSWYMIRFNQTWGCCGYVTRIPGASTKFASPQIHGESHHQSGKSHLIWRDPNHKTIWWKSSQEKTQKLQRGAGFSCLSITRNH